MVKIRLTGKIPFSEIAKGTKPEHVFLPRPSRVRSDLDAVELRPLTEHDMELEWEAVWYGDDLCRRVLKRSSKHLEYHNRIAVIYRKLGKVGDNEKVRKKELRLLIRENSKLISRWDNIVNSISSQLEASASP